MGYDAFGADKAVPADGGRAVNDGAVIDDRIVAHGYGVFSMHMQYRKILNAAAAADGDAGNIIFV